MLNNLYIILISVSIEGNCRYAWMLLKLKNGLEEPLFLLFLGMEEMV